MASRRVTTGLLPIPNNSETVRNSVHILLTSFMTGEAQVPFQVNRLAEDGTKIQIRSGVLAVPPGGAGRIVLDDVAGDTIEVNLELASEQLEPSVTIVRTAQASDTSDVTQWVTPDDFSELPSLEAEPPTELPRVFRTTGLIPVDVSAGATTPSFTYQLVLLISNFSNLAGMATHVLNWARPVFGAKTEIDQGTVTIESGTAGRVVFSDVAGRIVEVNLSLQGEALVPSIAVMRIDPSDEGNELVLWVSARDLADIPGPIASVPLKDAARDT